jgi:hypothetical protein
LKSKKDIITLKEVEEFDQAQCMDGRLIVLNRDGAGVSNFRVYSLYTDIE